MGFFDTIDAPAAVPVEAPESRMMAADQAQPEQPTPRGLLADGLYLGLSESVYRADPALGSSDMKLLSYDPVAYWHGSVLNPDREQKESTPAQILGTAVHRIVLDGAPAFWASYGPTDFSGSTKDGKAERYALAETGRIPLKREDFDLCLNAGAAIAQHPHLKDAFTGGCSEVSIVWTRDGVRRKARLDHMKVRSTTDLKTIKPQRSAPFADNCVRAVADYRYDVQAAHYHEARLRLAEFVRDGAVHGDHDPAWLARVKPEAAFVFVFLRADGIPSVHGFTVQPGCPLLTQAARVLDHAADNYRAAIEQFGPTRPWLLTAPLDPLDIEHMPAWFGR